MTISQLRESSLVVGSANPIPAWDQQWRTGLVDNLGTLSSQLYSVGITEIFVDGSFAADKPRPGDIDGYFNCDMMTWLTTQYPTLCGLYRGWDLTLWRPDSEGKPRRLMWHDYNVELFPNYAPPYAHVSAADHDDKGNPILFPQFFRQTRPPIRAKGIIQLLPGDVT